MNKFIDQILEENKGKNPMYIRAKIFSKAPENKIVDRMDDGTYKIHVNAQPVRGKANVELCKFLRKSLKATEVAIVSGGRDKVKLIRISL